MIKKCAACGKWFDVLYPHLWRYRREERYFCSWSCIRINDKGKEAKDMRGHRVLTQEQKSRAVEMALNGENPLPFLKECGASNPSASWNYIRKAAILEDPERAGIKIGISEEDLVGILNQLPLHWECAHLKNGTTRYKVIVPLGGPERAPFDEAEQTADRASAQTVEGASAQTVDGASEQAYPACEYVITVGDRQVKAVEIRMISDPGPDGWPDEILGFRAAAYYEKKAGEMPPLFRIEEQKDGRVLIRLFEELEDHIATWALYKSDRTGKGYDEAFDPNEKKVIDFMN